MDSLNAAVANVPAGSLIAGIVLAVLISAAAYKAHALSPSGALAATTLGTIIFGLGGLGWAVLLLAFFVSSSVLSRLFKRRKAALDEKFSKGTRRDAGQVLANGGIAGVFVLLHLAFPEANWPWMAFAGALAAANADTWATELGTLSRTTPRLITTGQKVERGTSGGISLMGTLSAAGGSLLIALLAVAFWQGRVFTLPAGAPDWLAASFGSGTPALPLGSAMIATAWITLAGTAGSLVDSLLGATTQAIYTCPCCQKETERFPLHTCGCRTTLKRGWSWLNNDFVNGFCTLAGGLIALIFQI